MPGSTLNPGARLGGGKYTLLHRIGEGGMAVIWSARQEGPEGFGKEVVIKVLRGDIARDPAQRSMFFHEARLLARMHHPQVVEVYDLEVGEGEEPTFLVMERLHGEDLGTVLKRCEESTGKPVPWPIAVRVIMLVCLGIETAHRLTDGAGKPLRIVHRDLKPSNVILTRDGNVKIIDFGIAKAVRDEIQTPSGAVKGTVAFMSPEQLRGRPLDARSDVFSTGILLYLLLTGELPFKGETVPESVYASINFEPPPIGQFQPGLPNPLNNVIRGALAKETAVRIGSAEEMRQQLAKVIVQSGMYVDQKDLARFHDRLFEEAELQEQRSAPFDPTEVEPRGPDGRPIEELPTVGTIPSVHALQSGLTANWPEGAMPIDRHPTLGVPSVVRGSPPADLSPDGVYDHGLDADESWEELRTEKGPPVVRELECSGAVLDLLDELTPVEAPLVGAEESGPTPVDPELVPVVGVEVERSSEGLSELTPTRDSGIRDASSGAAVEEESRAGRIDKMERWIVDSPRSAGQLLDGLGVPVGGQRTEGNLVPVRPDPLADGERLAVLAPFTTGVRAIDGLVALGHGQRVGLCYDSDGEKRRVLGMILRGGHHDTAVVHLCCKALHQVRSFVENVAGAEGMLRTTVVATTSEDPSELREAGAWTAAAIAEARRSQGGRVLLVYCDLDSWLISCDEHHRTAEDPNPETSVEKLKRLLGKPGRTAFGSITGLFCIREVNDTHRPALLVRSLPQLEGTIHLRTRVANLGVQPAVDVQASESVLMPQLVREEHNRAALRFREGLVEGELSARQAEFLHQEPNQDEPLCGTVLKLLRF